MWSWGRGDSGQLGLGELLHVLKPTQIVTLSEKVSQIAGGNSHSLFLTEKNSLLTCGNGQNGELGLHPVPSKPIVLPIPIDLKEASGHRIVSIACGPSFSAAIIGTDLYTWVPPLPFLSFPFLFPSHPSFLFPSFFPFFFLLFLFKEN